MSSQTNRNTSHHLAIKLWLASIALLLLLAGAGVSARVQGGFSSGSNEEDGPFSPTSSQSIQVQPDGVFNYTTFNIPVGVTITYIPNANNTPLTILTSGNVAIAGTIIISGQDATTFSGGIGGPGGARGGNGGMSLAGSTQGQPGGGPGGGSGGSGTSGNGGGGGYATVGVTGGGTTGGQGGLAYSGLSLLPLLGGSGGGGGSSTGVGGNTGGTGGGGGGAILIASSGNIVMNGVIRSNGGDGQVGQAGGGVFTRGGGGSGGAIRLITNTITGNGQLEVVGGELGGSATRTGAPGFIRVEAFNSGAFTPNILPNPGAVFSFSTPGSVTLPTTVPRLRIASVAGIAAPASPRGSFQQEPDILVPSTQSNPVTVAIEASNLPVGTVVDVTLTPERAAPTTVQSTPLAGTEANSTATASLTLSNVISVISVRVVIDLNLARPKSAASQPPIFIDGERVDRMEIASTFGGASEITYITRTGRRVKRAAQ